MGSKRLLHSRTRLAGRGEASLDACFEFDNEKQLPAIGPTSQRFRLELPSLPVTMAPGETP
jgi:hypothetical protein